MSWVVCKANAYLMLDSVPFQTIPFVAVPPGGVFEGNSLWTESPERALRFDDLAEVAAGALKHGAQVEEVS